MELAISCVAIKRHISLIALHYLASSIQLQSAVVDVCLYGVKTFIEHMQAALDIGHR